MDFGQVNFSSLGGVTHHNILTLAKEKEAILLIVFHPFRESLTNFLFRFHPIIPVRLV